MEGLHVLHNSYQSNYRKPFGAVACGQRIKLSIEVTSPSKDINIGLHVFEGDHQHVLDLYEINVTENSNNIMTKRTFEVSYQVPDFPCLVWYYFKLHIDDHIFYYGNNSESLGGLGQLYHQHPKAYQITVHLPVKVPSWYKESIMYQIFVDRFYNGDQSIKMKNYKKGSLIHTDWDDTPYYIKDRKGHVKRWDFFGGNLLGIIKKIPYLRKLGITLLYLNPIFDSVSNHKYDTGDYKKIDPAFGDDSIFEKLLEVANNNGINIILDGVFSHTGSDSQYFNRQGRYANLGAYQSKESPYYHWYRFNKYPDDYECWWGVDSLPNVNELEPSYLEYMVNGENSVIKHWLSKGIKGWRLDVADELPDPFIKKIKKVMRDQDHESILIGEVWEDASRKESYGELRQYLWGEELDGTMNYPFRESFINFILGNWDADFTHRKLMSLYENYPRETFYAAMNLIGSHDRIRILTLLGEGPDESTLSDEEREKYSLPREKRQLAIKRLKLLSLIQFTFPGVPCIYYGDEAGVEGYSDPFNRRTYPYGKEEKELLSWYIELSNLRSGQEALKKGQWMPCVAHEDVYGYRRIYEGKSFLCLFNRHKEEVKHVMMEDINWHSKLYDLLAKRVIDYDKGIELLPLEGKIILENFS